MRREQMGEGIREMMKVGGSGRRGREGDSAGDG